MSQQQGGGKTGDQIVFGRGAVLFQLKKRSMLAFIYSTCSSVFNVFMFPMDGKVKKILDDGNKMIK